MPGTSSVESDFSIINWTKDSHSKCLTNFSLEAILHCKQYGMLQELLGHSDVKTTEIYAHAAEIGNGKGVTSPLDVMMGVS